MTHMKNNIRTSISGGSAVISMEDLHERRVRRLRRNADRGYGRGVRARDVMEIAALALIIVAVWVGAWWLVTDWSVARAVEGGAFLAGETGQ